MICHILKNFRLAAYYSSINIYAFGVSRYYDHQSVTKSSQSCVTSHLPHHPHPPIAWQPESKSEVQSHLIPSVFLILFPYDHMNEDHICPSLSDLFPIT